MDTAVLSRRRLLGRSLASSAVAAMAALGIDLRPTQARAWALRIANVKPVPSVCPYCAVGCDTLIYAKDGAIIDIEGDPNSPINQGTLCPKGITLKHNIVNDRRLTKVRYRAPGGTAWEEKSWDWAIDRIARLVKDTRDKHFRATDAAGRTINALTSLGVIGGCTDTNEINYLLVKAFRAGLGVIPIEQQSRI